MNDFRSMSNDDLSKISVNSLSAEELKAFYGELAIRREQLEEYLINQGVDPLQFVGIQVESGTAEASRSGG